MQNLNRMLEAPRRALDWVLNSYRSFLIDLVLIVDKRSVIVKQVLRFVPTYSVIVSAYCYKARL